MPLKRKILDFIDTSFIKSMYEGYVFKRRIRVLTDHLAGLIPQRARVLDIGCGDGRLAHSILQSRRDIEVTGMDVLKRKKTYIPVTLFDGKSFPYADKSFDVAPVC